MKEQDYMNIMSTIRGEYLEEAVSWDGSERRRIRQIRRMTVSFGAVAAALAVVVGGIAYKANRDKIDIANSVPESSFVSTPDGSSGMTDTEHAVNLFGGHGELRQITGANGVICYDADYVYEWSDKWSVRSGGRMIEIGENELPEYLFRDGKYLFALHDSKIFETDSFGKETELIDFAEFDFPFAVDRDRIAAVQRLSDRLICIHYSDDSQFGALLIADLQTKNVAKQEDGSFGTLFPESETGYYAFNSSIGALDHYEMSGNTLTKQEVWSADDNYYDFSSAVIQNQKLCTVAKKYTVGNTGYERDPEVYLIADLSTKTVTETAFAENERIYAGTAFIRAAIADGSFHVYRSSLDLENEQLVFSVPVDQYLDTDAYGMPEMPEYLSVYESDDMLIVHLPLVTDGIARSARNGETGAKVDLKTGNAVFYGWNDTLSTPDENNAEGIQTAAVIGTDATAAETTAVTGALTTGTSAVTTAADSMTDAQRKAIAKELIDRYCTYYEGYAYGGLQEVDINDVKEVPDSSNPEYIRRYDRVLSMNSVAEVKRKLAEVAAGQAYDDLAGIVDGAEGSDFQVPLYLEIDGKLYFGEIGKGATFIEWLWDTIAVTSVTENGFSVSLKERNFGDRINIYYFDFTDVKDGSENSFRVSHLIYTSTDEVIPSNHD